MYVCIYIYTIYVKIYISYLCIYIYTIYVYIYYLNVYYTI